MNRTLALTAFLLGLLAVGWVGAGYIGHSPLALTMTTLIGVVYLAGGLELLRFQQATASLARALEAIPDELASLGDWLGKVHPSLHNAVRLRIEGERSGLPGPTMAPYLVGLLVLLGMLGTFLGMVVTLNGAVLALESTTDLHTIRAALAAPVKGLGVAFGTSVAGVAASAMLGLVSTLCRRQRLLTGQQLDTRIAGALLQRYRRNQPGRNARLAPCGLTGFVELHADQKHVGVTSHRPPPLAPAHNASAPREQPGLLQLPVWSFRDGGQSSAKAARVRQAPKARPRASRATGRWRP